MAFYGMQSLYPQTWGDTRDLPASGGVGSTPMPKSPTSDSIVSTDSAPNQAVSGAGEAPLDTSDPLGIKESILGRAARRRRSGVAGYMAEMDQLSSLLISSRTFDAKTFLRQVHKATSYRDFEAGADRLQTAIDHKEDVIKNLVKTHFSKFVNAKTTIDSFYDQMRNRNLISSDGYGIAPFDNSIDAVHADASVLYKPLLDRRVQAEKIRATLAVLGQWKFFFNLPSVLSTCARKHKYDALVRDYQKGAYLMQSSFGDPGRRMGASNAKDKDALLPQHHQVVFEKVWGEVSDIVAEARKALFQNLADPWTPLDVQERYMSYLIDLNAEPDPVQMYLERQYAWIQQRLSSAYEIHAKVLRDLATDPNPRRPASVFGLTDLRRALNIVRSQDFEVAFVDDPHVQQFKATQLLVRQLCDILMDTLPEFWRLCRIYCGGRLQKQKGSDGGDGSSRKRRLDSKKLEMCQSRIGDIVSLFCGLLARIFFADTPIHALRVLARTTLAPQSPPPASEELSVEVSSPNWVDSPIPPPPPPKEPPDAASTSPVQEEPVSPVASTPPVVVSPAPPSRTLPPASPTQLPLTYGVFLTAHPLTACFFFIKIMAELTRCQDHVRAVRIVGDENILTAMAGAVTMIRQRAVDVVCSAVLHESRNFYKYEDWTFEQDTTTTAKAAATNSGPVPGIATSQPLSQTLALAADSTTLLKLFYRLHTYVVRCLHRIAGSSPAALVSVAEAVRSAMNASMFAALDGLLWAAICGTSQVADENAGPETRAVMGNTPIWKRRVKALDISQPEVRILVAICNLQFLRKSALPKLTTLYIDRFGDAAGSAEPYELYDAMSQLDSLLFRNYITRTAGGVSSVVRSGILFEGLDWAGLTRPQEVRPYVFRLLLHLVTTHATVSAVSRGLVRRVLQELFTVLAADLLGAVRSVDAFSWGGMLQATLETQFIHQTLTAYETESCTQFLTLVYDSIERSAEQGEDGAGVASGQPMSQPQRDELLARVKLLLADAKRATDVQFSCFREMVVGPP
ncbi:hypothetical protein HKX48_008789 [Thoreauomyces humboldtii]|nr:hypothetical protein HKX48_008789 [Thoreauomyces humboldtii]